MELAERVTSLERELPAMKTDIAVVKSNYASKADLSNARNAIIVWVVSAVFMAQLLPVFLKRFGL
jgi:ABC-type metal ion transport system substrate-binding protein